LPTTGDLIRSTIIEMIGGRTHMANGPDQGWRQHVIDNVLPKMEATTEQATGLTPAPLSTIVTPTPFSVGFPSPPSFDPLEALPPLAQERLRKLRDRAADAHAVCVPFADIQEASTARIEAENRLRQLQAHPQEFGSNLPPTDARVVTQQRLVNKLTDDFRRLQERSEMKLAAWQAASAALAACEDFPRHGVPGNTTLEAVEVEPPKLLKNETLLDYVERQRRDGRRVKADIHRVRSACYTKAEAMALVSATVENWGGNGIDTSATIEHLSQPTIPTKTVQAMVHNVPGAPAAVAFVEVPDVAAIFSTVLKDQFIAWLAADVDRNADPEGALSLDQRQQQEAELMADQLSIERSESAAVWAAQSEGLPIEHRADISPLALLGVRLVTTPRADALPETSPGYSWPWR
jgi:hypothetical protein